MVGLSFEDANLARKWLALRGFYFVTIAILITGCVSGSIGTITPPTATIVRRTFTPTHTSTPTATDTHISTPSTTLQPSATLISMATETPMAPLSLELAQQKAEELLNTNANCSLPCWWGITPGRTSWTAAQSFLFQIDQKVYSRTARRREPFVAEVFIPVRKEFFSLGRLIHRYTINQGVVQLIEIQYGTSPAYSLQNIFTRYGEPTEAYIRTSTESPSGYLNFQLVVFFQELGIVASYDQQAQNDGTHVSSCVGLTYATELVLWSPSGLDEFVSIVNQTGLTDQDLGYLTLQEATTVAVDSFFEKLSSPGSQLCLQTPADLW